MNSASDLETRLAELRNDYGEVVGGPWATFFCPIAFRDEPVELCRGHVVPNAFPDSDRNWTVQRKDVDAFYGSVFEADYVALRHKGERRALDGLKDHRLKRELQPKVRMDGREIGFYKADGPVPTHHTPVVVQPDSARIELVLKIAPSDVLATEGRNWELGFERDLRVPVLVTALRSAHLTLFHLLGYRYALSAAGHFVGWDILGKFFTENAGTPRQQAIAEAPEHFGQFANLVRPLEAFPESLRGTVSDKKLYLCKTDAWPWAFQVFVRTGKFMHAVMIPCFQTDHSVVRYLRFLEGHEQEYTAYLTQFDGDQWNVSTEPATFTWPESRFDEDPAIDQLRSGG